MESRSRFIAPERMGAWLVVTLGVALLALITAIWAVRESRVASIVAQAQVLKLDERIRALEAERSGAPAMPTAAPENNEMSK